MGSQDDAPLGQAAILEYGQGPGRHIEIWSRARPPYWNMVKFHRAEGNGAFSKGVSPWELRTGPHWEIGSLQMELGS
jgi:hypothetical protein